MSAPILSSICARGAMSSFRPSRSATPLAMCRSVWKLPASLSRVVAVGEARGGDQQLEQIDRGRIGDQHLVRLRPDQGRDLRAHAARHADPVAAVPAADQLLAPFLLDHRALARRHLFRQRPKRIAVEIDQALGQMKAVAQGAQRIGGVGGPGLGEGEAHRRRPSARSISSTAAAQARVSGAISSTWPVRSIMRTRTSSPAARIGRA